MTWFTPFLTRQRGAAQAINRQGSPRRVPLALECLEERTLLTANVFVVPVTAPADATHFYSLAAALPAAGSLGTVTIQPGAALETTAVNVTQAAVVIQGDPNIPGSILPSYDLNVNASGVLLVNLHLGEVLIGAGFNTTTVRRSLVNNITEVGAVSGNGSNTITQNQITGSVRLQGNSGGTATNNVVTFNTFASANFGSILLSVDNNTGVRIQSNSFLSRGFGSIGITVEDSGTVAAPAVIANNTISMAGAGSIGMTVTKNGPTFVRILNNTITTNDSIGLTLRANGDQSGLTALVQGNDFHGNQIGVTYGGTATGTVNVDLGGGVPGSLGGNNFRSFTTRTAIQMSGTVAGATLPAQGNIFRTGISPDTVISDGTHGSGSGNIDVSAPLSANRSFVQTLYNSTLGRSGALGELDGWVSVLINQGQAAVANGILRSRESLGRIIDGYYLQFLGRQSDAGREGWINLLQSGARQEDVQATFLSTPEFLSHSNTDYVQALYLLTLHRTGNAAELAGWYSVLPALGLKGVAAAFTNSQENRYHEVADDFQRLLHRTASAGELSGFAGSSADLLTLEAAVLSSGEFFTNG